MVIFTFTYYVGTDAKFWGTRADYFIWYVYNCVNVGWFNKNIFLQHQILATCSLRAESQLLFSPIQKRNSFHPAFLLGCLDCSSAGLETPCRLWNHKIHYTLHDCPSTNWVTWNHFCKIQSVPFVFSEQILLSFVIHNPPPPNAPIA
jgi:hypothetical protein